MNTHATKFFWVFLLLPTVLLGMITLLFLHRETDRILAQEASYRTSLKQQLEARAENIASAIHVSVEEVLESLQDQLLPPGNHIQGREWLDSLPEDFPLIRRVFLWDQDRGWDDQVAVLYFQAFQDRVPWLSEPSEAASTMAASASSSNSRQIDARQSLLNLARTVPYPLPPEDVPVVLPRPPPIPGTGSPPPRVTVAPDPPSPPAANPEELQPSEAEPEPSSPTTPGEDAVKSGWIWIENPLSSLRRRDSDTLVGMEEIRYLFGWRYSPSTREAVAVEMDLPRLRQSLLSFLPEPEEATRESFELHWPGKSRASQTPVAPGDLTGETAIGPSLPGWSIRFHSPLPRADWNPRMLFWIGTLVVLGVTGSVAVGSGLLLRQVHNARREAQGKATFLANVSHELKTPLTTIQMYAEMLDGDRVADEGRRYQYLETIRQEAERLSRLVGNLLHQNRLERGEFDMAPEPVDLGSLVADLVEQAAPSMESMGIRIAAEVASPLPRAWADPDAVRQILTNLMENARKYAAQGGELRVEVDLTSRGIRASVLDRGPGVPYNFRRRLFSQFERADDALSARVSGMGLGLSIARGQARAMGGDLIYRPRPGGGAIFSLILKRAPNHPP